MCIRFLLQGFDRREAKDVAFKLASQIVVLQNDIESLVPRYVVEDDRQGTMHVRIKYDVQTADPVDQAEEVFQINIFQVHRDRLARVLRAARRRSLRHWAFCPAARFTAGCEAAPCCSDALGFIATNSEAGLSANFAAASSAFTEGSTVGFGGRSLILRLVIGLDQHEIRRRRRRLGFNCRRLLLATGALATTTAGFETTGAEAITSFAAGALGEAFHLRFR